MALRKTSYLTAFSLGVIIGYYTTVDREFRVDRDRNYVGISSVSQGTSYPLTSLGGDVFLGNSQHHLSGVRAAALCEGQEAMRPRLESLENKVSDLQRQNLMKDIRNVYDRTVYKIKEGWHNFMEDLRR